MSAPFSEHLYLAAGGFAGNTTGDKHIFPIPCKAEIIRVGVNIQGASAHATQMVVKLDSVQNLAARGDGDLGVFTKPASDQEGKLFFKEPATRITLNAGDYVAVEVTTANGDAVPFGVVLELRRIPEVPANQANMSTTGWA